MCCTLLRMDRFDNLCFIRKVLTHLLDKLNQFNCYCTVNVHIDYWLTQWCTHWQLNTIKKCFSRCHWCPMFIFTIYHIRYVYAIYYRPMATAGISYVTFIVAILHLMWCSYCIFCALYEVTTNLLNVGNANHYCIIWFDTYVWLIQQITHLEIII